MSEQQDQQILQKYQFVITPLEIKSNSKIKTTSQKSILIKLGSKTAKCSQLNTPVELQMDVLYSKTLQKYCPIKGIIKIYDVAEDGTEIISSVGGFQTDQLLNDGKNRVLLEKEIGTSKLKMQISIINKAHNKPQEDKQAASKQNLNQADKKQTSQHLVKQDQKRTTQNATPQYLQSPNPSTSTQPSTSHISHLPSSNSNKRISPLLKPQNSTSKQIELPFKNTSNSINKSLEKINQALNFRRFQESNVSNRANEVLAKAEIETAKQQLHEEKRKSTALEDKLHSASQKLNICKANLTFMQSEIKNYIASFKKIVSSIEFHQNSPITVLDSSTHFFSLKYKSRQIEPFFKDFLSLISKKCQEQPLPEIDYESNQSSRSLFELEQNRKELAILKKLTNEKDKKISSLERQIEGAELTIRNLKETNKHLGEENQYLKETNKQIGEENQYLRQKNDQIELSLYHKETSIDALNAQVEKNTEELYNSSLIIQELREQVSNCSQTIDRYRQKYGDLKNVKNRAIEMQIKECLRWIQLQNRDLEMSGIEETAQSEHSSDRGDSLSQVIRNIEIEKVPKEEMSIIRDELVRILQKVDQLMK